MFDICQFKTNADSDNDTAINIKDTLNTMTVVTTVAAVQTTKTTATQ